MQWFGKPTPQNRFLGQVDQDDPTNLPMGLAALCRNFDFTRDSGGPTCATTRAGINTAMQCIDPAAPVTGAIGFVYEPVSADDSLLTPIGPFVARCQRPLAFQPTQGSQYEAPLGTGRMVKFPQTNFTEPQTTGVAPNKVVPHAIQASAGNKVFSAYSDLAQPLSGLSTMDPKALTLNPYGMKPFGWNWLPLTAILQNEVATPSAPRTGNGHTYQAQNAGATGPNEPIWPLTDGGIVVEVLSAAQIAAGLVPVTWKEKTMVIANRLPAPAAPALALAGAGTIPAGQDVYIAMTLLNTAGETLPSTPVFITTVAPATTISVAIPPLAALPTWMQNLPPAYVPTQANVYTAIVPTGSPAPALSTFQQYGGSAPLNSILGVNNAGAGVPPPTTTTARVTPGQLPTPTDQPIIDRDPAGGTFVGGLDVYVLKTYKNSLGETPAGPANNIVNTNLNDGVLVTVTVPLGPNNEKLYAIDTVGIYEANVPTGEPAPPASAFSLVGYFQPSDNTTITTPATGPNPPLTNTTGPGGSIVADTATGGANGTQGYRYAACGWINQMQTFSGFTLASVVKTIIDEDGWEIGAFNVCLGMTNVVGRYIPFSIADASQAGPFNWIGLVNLEVPSQNVVYPMQTLIDQVEQSATVFLDNVTTQGTFNFTDTYLSAQNNVDDRLRVVQPPQGVRVDYLETVQRVAITGVPGLRSGVYISLGSDPESFYGDVSPVPIASAGDTCFGVTDQYKGIPIAMMESGGFTLSPNTGNPNSWAAVRRWGGIDPGQALGPCGFRAWSACGKFIIFAHRSGLYKYDESDPDMMSKEIPRKWATINWAACASIAVTIDEDTHTVRVQVPTGASTTNNEEFCLSYIEGWQNPIHFSTYSGKEISMDAARRWSFNDVSAFLCLRMKRSLPAGGNAFIDGPTWNTLPDSSFQVSQLLYASSGLDGTVQARTPGIFADNGAGIADEYETMSVGMMQAVCKPEGFNLNACGWGTLFASFIASREELSDEGGEQKLLQVLDELETDPIALSPKQVAGITRKCGPSLNEFWRVRFKGDRQPGSWFSLKALTTYVIPFTGGRDPGDR
jgi:hypothetical protein